jgi:hypothetical protein
MATAPQTAQLTRYTNTYTTFSGADIVASFGGVAIGTLSGITWSVTREKAPIYTMGSANPRSFSRGKRGIAGSLIFIVFDRPSLYTMLQKHAADNDNSVKYFTRSSNVLPSTDSQSNVTHRGIVPPNEQTLDIRSAFPYYADQIPPFDITVTFANEYGQAAVRSIYGVELLNEGSGASMDDIVIEETMTYVAREIGPMYATGQPRDPNFTEMDKDISASGIIIP